MVNGADPGMAEMMLYDIRGRQKMPSSFHLGSLGCLLFRCSILELSRHAVRSPSHCPVEIPANNQHQIALCVAPSWTSIQAKPQDDYSPAHSLLQLLLRKLNDNCVAEVPFPLGCKKMQRESFSQPNSKK